MVTKKGNKTTGGKYNKQRKRKKDEREGQKRTVKLSEEEKRKTKKVRGRNIKNFLLRAKFINIKKKNNEKGKKIEIKNVLETPSNRFLARQNVLTKGTIVQTEEGKAKITNRPTQEGMINGILLQEEKK